MRSVEHFPLGSTARSMSALSRRQTIRCSPTRTCRRRSPVRLRRCSLARREQTVTDPLSYYIGLDLGQSQDYTAISIVEEPVWVGHVSERRLLMPCGGWISPDELDPYSFWEACEDVEEHGRPPNPPL
jgi:hypothetical protein